ncbi:hypothetical protein AM265_18505 [Escherichia coli]|jgi:hypothetical protein|nr:hypothetical protein [Citrobacter amalonaticus]KAA0541424.1 hypothetical protein F0328_19175 [Citrobacter portucalensis]KQJ05970.1 hypothetical protein AM265_18505 [Escherichia coli]MBD0807065.1 hypothetical protein [Citrobacter sp. C13]MBJ9334247.1 hypothetical protein [Citrobacter freundii]
MEMPPENNVKGLSETEMQARLAQYGYNEVREQPPGQLRANCSIFSHVKIVSDSIKTDFMGRPSVC